MSLYFHRYAHAHKQTHKMLTPSAHTESTRGGLDPGESRRTHHAMQMPRTLALSAGQFSVLVRQGASLLPVLPVLNETFCAGTRLHTQVCLALALGHVFILHFCLHFLQASNCAKWVENTTVQAVPCICLAPK